MPCQDNSYDSNYRLANWHLLLANQNRHSSEQGTHLNPHSKMIMGHQLWVINSLVSILYLLFKSSLTHDCGKQKLQDK